MRAHLIGHEGKGISELAMILHVTRMHLTIAALSAWGRALAAGRAFARVRKVARGTKLSEVPLHMRGLAKAHVSYRAHMQLGFFVNIALLGSSEMKVKPSLASPHDLLPKNLQDVQCLLGLLGSISKATTAKATLIGSRTAMESLGGVGYLENEEIERNVARLARDCAVLCTGEGTTDVLATDVGKGSGER